MCSTFVGFAPVHAFRRQLDCLVIWDRHTDSLGRHRAPTAPYPLPKVAQLRMAGFGSGSGGSTAGRRPKKGGSAGGSKGPPKRKQRAVRATYLELVERGCTEFVCFARPEGSGDDGWRRVGTIVADRDDCCTALTENKRVVLEHAKRLHPQLGLVKVLEVGFGKEAENAGPPLFCERTEGTVTSAFSPDAVSSGAYYAPRRADGRLSPVDTSSRRPANTFKPRRTGEGKTPSD